MPQTQTQRSLDGNCLQIRHAANLPWTVAGGSPPEPMFHWPAIKTFLSFLITPGVVTVFESLSATKDMYAPL